MSDPKQQNLFDTFDDPDPKVQTATGIRYGEPVEALPALPPAKLNPPAAKLVFGGPVCVAPAKPRPETPAKPKLERGPVCPECDGYGWFPGASWNGRRAVCSVCQGSGHEPLPAPKE